MASASSWQALIDKWQLSGLTQSEFCRQHQLSTSTFSGRLSKHKDKSLKPVPVVSLQKAPLSMLPVTVIPSRASSDPAPQGITFKHATKGHQLQLSSSVSAKWVAELFQCLD